MIKFFKWYFAQFSPGWLPALIAAGAALAGTAASMSSARSANQETAARQEDAQSYNTEEAARARAFNAEEAEKARSFSAAQVKSQEEFQRDMASTQHQRATADLRAAGLNPILSASSGFQAAAPQGAAATGYPASAGAASSPAPQQAYRAEIGNILTSAVQIAQLDNINAQTEKTRAETKVVESDIIPDDKDPGSFYTPKTFSARERSERSSLLREETLKAREGIYLTAEQKNLVQEEIQNAVEERRAIQARTGNIHADTVLKRLATAEAKAASEFWSDAGEGWYGLRQGGKAASEALGSALGLKRLFRR